ncbi:HNH endonuclease [Pseudomonas sp. MAFF 730085]|uniref:HNH endonuclease n=1 Tax=Pseudomonas kitaguniensis TaxID=2607908 RepID=A0A5N7JSX1_9PSED|nr:HNH endonuclease [Pseudomonas kitaguniensis]MPQ84498.1 HNH endonuclease [Pseudomonas kitaguniensis]
MAKIASLKSRLTPVDSRKTQALTDGSSGDTWGAGRGGRPWRRKRESILIRDNYTCRVCGLTTKDLEVDHIINVAQGGTDDDGNLQAICIPCHKAKTARESSAHRG